MLPTLFIPAEMRLADNDQWQFRFQIQSESSNRLYTIAQHKTKKHWGCDCPGWKRFKHCKHLTSMGLPGDQKPYEPNVLNS
jgi:hypothetical protein